MQPETSHLISFSDIRECGLERNECKKIICLHRSCFQDFCQCMQSTPNHLTDKNKAVLEANQSDLIIYKNLHDIINTVECSEDRVVHSNLLWYDPWSQHESHNLFYLHNLTVSQVKCAEGDDCIYWRLTGLWTVGVIYPNRVRWFEFVGCFRISNYYILIKDSKNKSLEFIWNLWIKIHIWNNMSHAQIDQQREFTK